MAAEVMDQRVSLDSLLEQVSAPFTENVTSALENAGLTVLEIDRLTGDGAKVGACAETDEILAIERDSLVKVVGQHAVGADEAIKERADAMRMTCVARYAGQQLLTEITNGYYAIDPDSYRTVIESGFRLPAEQVLEMAEHLLTRYVQQAPRQAHGRDDFSDSHLAIADAFLYLGANMADEEASQHIQERKAEMVLTMLRELPANHAPGMYAALDLIRPVEEESETRHRGTTTKFVLPAAILAATIASPLLFSGRASAETVVAGTANPGGSETVVVVPRSSPTAVPDGKTSVGVTDLLSNTSRTPDGSIVIRLSDKQTRAGGQTPTPNKAPGKTPEVKLDSRDASSIYQSLIAEFPPVNGRPALIVKLANDNFETYAQRMQAGAAPTDAAGLRKMMLDNTMLAYLRAGAEHPILLAADGQKHTNPHAISAALVKEITGDPANKDLLERATAISTQLAKYSEGGKGYFDGWTREQIAMYAILQARLDMDLPAPAPAAGAEQAPSAETGDYQARLDQGRLALIKSKESKWKGDPQALLDLVKKTTAKYNHPVINTDAVLVQDWAESKFDVNAVSRAGAIGIAQFMPGTAQTWVHGSPRDPEAAIDAQVRYMIWIYDKKVKDNTAIPWSKKLDMTYAGYNSGPNNITDYGLDMLNWDEASGYVQHIHEAFEAIYGNTPADPTMGQRILATAKQFDGIFYKWGGGVHNDEQSARFANQCPAQILKNAASKSTEADPGPCAPDCSGLIAASIQIITGHNPSGWTVQAMEDDYKNWKQIPWSEARPGDAAIRNENGYGEHVEIITSEHVTGSTVVTYGAHQKGTRVSSGGANPLSFWNAGAWRYIGPSHY